MLLMWTALSARQLPRHAIEIGRGEEGIGEAREVGKVEIRDVRKIG